MTRPTSTQCEMLALSIMLVAFFVVGVVRDGLVSTLLHALAWLVAFFVITVIIAAARAMGRDQ